MSDTKPDIIIEFPSWDGVGVVGYTLDATYTRAKDGNWKKKRGDIGVVGKQFVAEIERQQAIVDKLDKTADGVAITIGMVVFLWLDQDDELDAKGFVTAIRKGDCTVCIDGEFNDYPHEAYQRFAFCTLFSTEAALKDSTREAALAAKEKS